MFRRKKNFFAPWEKFLFICESEGRRGRDGGQLLERHERVKTFVEGKRRKRPETHISTGN